MSLPFGTSFSQVSRVCLWEIKRYENLHATARISIHPFLWSTMHYSFNAFVGHQQSQLVRKTPLYHTGHTKSRQKKRKFSESSTTTPLPGTDTTLPCQFRDCPQRTGKNYPWVHLGSRCYPRPVNSRPGSVHWVTPSDPCHGTSVLLVHRSTNKT